MYLRHEDKKIFMWFAFILLTLSIEIRSFSFTSAPFQAVETEHTCALNGPEWQNLFLMVIQEDEREKAHNLG